MPHREPGSLAVSESVLARDERLLRAWQRGDTDSGFELLRLYQPLFYQLCGRRGLTREDEILDVHSEMVLELLEKRQRLYLRTGFATCIHWAFRTAVRRWERGRQREQRLESADRAVEEAQPELEAREERDTILRSLLECAERLDSKEFGLFSGRLLEKRSYAELAEHRSLSEGALRTQLHRVLRKLRDCLTLKGVRGTP